MKTLDQNLDEEDISELKKKSVLAMIKGMKSENQRLIINRVYPPKPKKVIIYSFYFENEIISFD